jgi:hypothetical protein
LGIYGQPFGKPVKKPYLQHRIGVVFRHRPIRHQLNNCMKTLREMIDLIESAQSGRPELRTWGNRSTGETHYSVDGVEVGKDQYYQAWRADQKNQGNPDIKEEEVDEDQATAKMGLMSAMGSNDNNPADQRRVMAQQAVEQLAAKR